MLTLYEWAGEDLLCRQQLRSRGQLLALIQNLGEVVDGAVLLAGDLDEGVDSTIAFDTMGRCRLALSEAEALLAVIANRVGHSWNRMAAHYGVSKQAHHRRLAATGERAWLQAQRELSDAERNVSQLAERWVFDPAAVAAVARNGAATIARRAPWLLKSSSPNVSRADAAAYIGGRLLWPAILRRPDD
jgi:hypothetical protein